MLTVEDDQVVEAVLRGNADAFGDIVLRYEKPIFNLMYRTTGSRDEAADLTQDAFLRAYDKLHTYRLGRKFYTWLYSLSMNVARDYIRKRHRRLVTTDHDPEKAAERTWGDAMTAAGTDRSDDMEILHEVMGTLPLNDREAVLLRYRDGLKMKEIAEHLGLSVSGAKMRVHRGLGKLQRAWRDKGHDR